MNKSHFKIPHLALFYDSCIIRYNNNNGLHKLCEKKIVRILRKIFLQRNSNTNTHAHTFAHTQTHAGIHTTHSPFLPYF